MEQRPSWLRKIEERYAWGVIGVLLSLLFGAAGLYTFFHERKPNVSYEITNESNVLDLRQPIKNLSILFQNQDIEQKNLNLRIFDVKVENTGEIDILQNHMMRIRSGASKLMVATSSKSA